MMRIQSRRVATPRSGVCGLWRTAFVGLAIFAMTLSARADVVYFTTGSSVNKITPDGTVSTFVQATAQNDLGTPEGIAIDGRGNLYTSTAQTGDIVKITPDGNTSVFSASHATSLIYAGLATDMNGTLYAAEPNYGVVKFVPDGSTIPIATGLPRPWSVAVDASGNVYTVNQDYSISKITQGGPVTTFTSNASSGGLTFDSSGNLYTVAANDHDIVKIAPDGSVTAVATGFNALSGLAFDSAGDLYVADWGASAINRIARGGGVTTVAQGMAARPFFLAIATPEPSCLAIVGCAFMLASRRRR